jgi:hemerythrin
VAWDSTDPERNELFGEPGTEGCSAASTHTKATLKICPRKMGPVTLLTWNHACSTGVEAMDDQHGVLLDTLNELRLALVHGRSRDEVNEGLNRLIELTRLHFSSEEKLLEQQGYPGAAEHRGAHQRLLAQIEEAAHRAQHSNELHMHSLLLFLRDWYMNHVESLDHQYGAWLNERGIA